MVEIEVHLRLHSLTHRVLLIQARELECHQTANRWLQCSVCVMEPIDVFGVVLVGGWESQLSTTVNKIDVVGACCRLGKGQIAILDNWCLAKLMEVFDGLRAVDRVALVELEIIFEVKFFAEPNDALGLRNAHMMYDKHDGIYCKDGQK